MSARIFVIFVTVLLSLTNIRLASGDQLRLDKIHQDIVNKYSDVEHLSGPDFQELDISQALIFDVREAEEFAVSHINGAFRIDPDTELAEFSERYADRVAGKTVVFYCSVGRRSSDLLRKLSPMLETNGAIAAYNLVGGIFRWRNEQRPLVDLRKEETQLVHPYNFYWGRLIDDRSAVRYKP